MEDAQGQISRPAQMRPSYDVIIIGGGHNGLVCGAYLAGAGLRTLILERRALVGGACVTEEPWPGFRVSTTSYTLSLFPSRIIRDLDLRSFGFGLIPTDNLFVPFGDGTGLTIWDDNARTVDSIAQFSKRDAGRYPEYKRHLEALGDMVRQLMWLTPPASLSLRALIDSGRLAWTFKRMGRDAGLLVDLVALSAAEFLDRWFESDQLKAALAYYASLGAFKGPMTPGSAYSLLHFLMGEHEGAGGWGFVRGGMGGLTQALAESALARGAQIVVGEEVRSIETRDGQATGVVLGDGRNVAAKKVISNADPKSTLLSLVGRDLLPADVSHRIENFTTVGHQFKINLAIDRLPTYVGFTPGKGIPFPAYVHIGPTMEYLERAYDDAKYGRTSSEPWISPVVPTTHDDSLAPSGSHIMNILAGHTPYTLADGDWRTEREVFTDRVISKIDEYVKGDFASSILQCQTLSPRDLEEIYGLPEGHVFHGEMSLNQLFVMRPLLGNADYRTPIRDLYLCGAGTHPGGGVSGIPGHNAAREVLRDVRSEKRTRRW